MAVAVGSPPWALAGFAGRTARRYSPVIGIAVLILAWQVVASVTGNPAVPTPVAVLARIGRDGFGFYWANLSTTLAETLAGLVIGNVIGLGLGIVAASHRLLTRPALHVAMLTYTVPIIAVGVILTTLYSGSVPRIATAAIYVVFTTTLGTVAGLRASSRRSLELMEAFGARRPAIWVKVRIPSAMPNIATGLKLSAPAAMLGAIVGSYLGGDRGVGVAMVAAQRSGDVERTWAFAVLATVVAALLYGAMGFATGRFTRWLPDMSSTLWSQPPMRWYQRVSLAVAVLMLSLGLWTALLYLMDVDAFLSRTPLEVADYLIHTTPAERAALLSATGETLAHAALGFVAGLAAALATAALLTLRPASRGMVMPMALLGQAVPFVVFLPVCLTVFGRGLVSIAIVGGLVSFFPVLLNIDDALRRTPLRAGELLACCGYSRSATLRKVQLPYATVALIASTRIAVPGALAGAVLVEYLALGNGLGHLMVTSVTQFDYSRLWAAVVLLTCASVVLGATSRVVERRVCRRLHLPAEDL
ncbi:ABC transporter permease [Mycolicibacterium palauense]|uniref:ABC transporter permease n=1 Tax=Mycolicibacterium palauense TaxID=2034511 RepID=UPI001C3F161E|nr:ABC transporter permease subunit [Mycolicibacterium palauense]